MNKFVANRFFSLIFIPLVLFFLWVFLILFYNPYTPFSVLRYGQTSYDRIEGKKGELLAGEKVQGGFKAKDDFLGIVNFSFNNFNRTNLDTIVFKIKEKNGKYWYAINKYKVDRFNNGFNYPFGFPPIKESKNKIYVFEIESLNGKIGDSIGVNQAYPFLSTNYVFPRSYYFSDKNSFTNFFIKKFVNLLTNFLLFYPILLIYLFPLVFYLLLPIATKRKYADKYILFFPLLILILLDKFLIDKTVDLITFEIQLFWIMLIIIYKWESSVTFFFSLMFILLMPIFILFNQIEIAEKIAIQTYFFLIIAVSQFGIEVRFNTNNRVSYKRFLINIFGKNRFTSKLK